MNPRVTVAVSTYQRAHLLPRLVAALEAQTLGAGAFEVVIADNGSTDHTAEVLAHLAQRSPLAIEVVSLAANRGAAAGRNAAWRRGRAPVVAFTDDDCEPDPAWLEEGLAAMEQGADIVVGRTRPRPEDTHLLTRPFARTVDVGGVRFYETCNVFYRRSHLEAVGGFDETYEGVGGEDTDLALRVVEATGATSAFASGALVLHEVTPGSWLGAVRATLRWTGIPLLVKRHPGARDLFHRRYFWRPAHPATLVAMAGLAAAPRHPAAALLVLPWVWHRVVRDPLCPGPRRRWLALPGGFALDALEVAVMLRGSWRHRAVLV